MCATRPPLGTMDARRQAANLVPYPSFEGVILPFGRRIAASDSLKCAGNAGGAQMGKGLRHWSIGTVERCGYGSGMNRQALIDRIVASLHEAMFDDTRWPATSALIDEACGSKGNMLVFAGGTCEDGVQIFFVRFCFRGERYEDRERGYFSEYYPLDERVPRIRQLADSRLVHVSSLFTDEEMKVSPVYNEAVVHCDARDSLTVRLDGPNGSRIVWTMADPIEGDGWSSATVETLERLLPHLRQFVRVRHALVDAGALGSSLAALLENTGFGVVQLDLRAWIVAANNRARVLLNRGDGLCDRDGLLHARLPDDDDALQRLLARALPPFAGQGASGSMMVSRALVSPKLILHVSPVNRAREDARASRVGALVLVVDPVDRAVVEPELVASMLGLTPAESHVAVSMAQGKTIREIAIETGRSEGTVRWHVKRIFARHGVSRQLEIARLVLSLADIAQSRRRVFDGSTAHVPAVRDALRDRIARHRTASTSGRWLQDRSESGAQQRSAPVVSRRRSAKVRLTSVSATPRRVTSSIFVSRR